MQPKIVLNIGQTYIFENEREREIYFILTFGTKPFLERMVEDGRGWGE